MGRNEEKAYTEKMNDYTITKENRQAWLFGYEMGLSYSYEWFRDYPNKKKGINKATLEFKKHIKYDEL